MSNINVIEKQGTKEGKNVVILAGVHGNEVCGVKAFDKLIPKLEINAGKVTFIYANIEAIQQGRRFVEANLNRCFLKEQDAEIKETLEGKTSREIIPYLEKADAMLDVHASNTQDSEPFVICRESLIEKARIFDVEKLVCNFDMFEPGSTDYYMNLQGKEGFCIECGFIGDQKAEETAEKAIWNFLKDCGCIYGEIESAQEQKSYRLIELYNNKADSFRKARYFPDFEKLEEKTLIGFDGEKEVYVEAGKVMLFVRDREKMNEECFLVAEEI